MLISAMPQHRPNNCARDARITPDDRTIVLARTIVWATNFNCARDPTHFFSGVEQSSEVVLGGNTPRQAGETVQSISRSYNVHHSMIVRPLGRPPLSR